MNKSSTFYNTIGLDQTEKKAAERHCRTQESVILQFFKLYPARPFTPFQVKRQLFDSNTPITSIRRAITNLEQAGELEKTGNMIKEEYGKPNHCWRLRINQPEQVRLY